MNKQEKQQLIKEVLKVFKENEIKEDYQLWSIKRFMECLNLEQVFKELKNNIYCNWDIEYNKHNHKTYTRAARDFEFCGEKIYEDWENERLYSETTLTIPEIAKKEMVNYLVEIVKYYLNIDF